MIKFFLRTYVIPLAILFLVGIKGYQYVPPEVKASVFNDWPDGRIAFASNRDGNWELYTINPDGTDLTRLTNTPNGQEFQPAWSPEGEYIAFVSVAGGNYDIEIMDADGANRKRITTSPAKEVEPCWSPEGDRIAFTSYLHGNGEICVVKSDGSGLVGLSGCMHDDCSPDWHPDGDRVFFLRRFVYKKTGATMGRVFAVHAGGGGAREMTEEYPYLGNAPKWSRNGRRIAFCGGVFPTHEDGVIYIMKSGRHSCRRLMRGNACYDSHPAWSPDGRKLAFSRQPAKDGHPVDIYVVSRNSSGLINLTNGQGDNDYPDWR